MRHSTCLLLLLLAVCCITANCQATPKEAAVTFFPANASILDQGSFVIVETDDVMSASALNVDVSAFRGISWNTSAEDTAALENGIIKGENVIIKGVELYKNPADLTYGFRDKLMVFRKYTAKRKAFDAIFVSLFLRYGGPTLAGAKKTVAWDLPDITIVLVQNAKTIVTYTYKRQPTEIYCISGE